MAMMKFAKKSITKDTLDGSWKILVVDDEKEVHNITNTVLKQFTFNNKSLNILSAFSGNEAIDILKNNQDIAMVLLDVVMETDDAGLKVAKQIREQLNNKIIRIVLRTGQPGIFPAKDIIYNYDINDYREKTELTSTKLYITVLTALRSYNDLLTIKQNEKQLLKQSKFVSMGEMMDAVAHQWKQPLSAIKLYIEGLELLAEVGTVTNDDIKKTTKNTKIQIDHLLLTIDEFRKMLKNKPVKEKIHLNTLINDTLSLLKDSLMKYNISFIINGDKKLYANIMPIEFKHIIINIINNAKDELVNNNIQQKEIKITYEIDENFIHFKIVDNAGGIPKDILNNIFDVNFTTKDEDKGSGMGLYMSKLFCEKMDCIIEATNTQNGACFNIKIPTIGL